MRPLSLIDIRVLKKLKKGLKQMNMNKRLLVLLASVGTLVGMVSAVNAATTSNNFTVSATLSSQCQASNSGTQEVAFGSYTAFQAGDLTSNSVNLTFDCTNGFAPTSVAFDATNGTVGGDGVLNGVLYTLTAGAASTAAGAVATKTTAAAADVVTYAVSGTMLAGQSGQCAAASCGPTNHTRTLILTF